ncbi:MAG: antitoxin VapB family protein [Thermoplasmata archaeon]|nr:antitoxin VapB family protein [Thermoplasmata archaeon]
MPTKGAKSVTLDQEAYELLRSQMRPAESFSDVVKRLAKKPDPLASFAGTWKDLPEKVFRDIHGNRKRVRELDAERSARLLRRGSG